MPSLHRHGTDRKGVGIFQQVFCNAKRADVYTSALLADAMKPLNVLSKFENHFAIRTVRFQVQLEADGYFSAQKISCLHPPQAGRVGTNSQFFESVFTNPASKRLLGFAQTRYFAQNCAVTVCKNAEHDCAETSSMIAQKCTPNQRNKNNLSTSLCGAVADHAYREPRAASLGRWCRHRQGVSLPGALQTL